MASLVDPVEDEWPSRHECGSEQCGVALETFLDHGGRVHHRVGCGVSDPKSKHYFTWHSSCESFELMISKKVRIMVPLLRTLKEEISCDCEVCALTE